MIYTINARDYLLYPIMKRGLALADADVYQTISDEFAVLQKRLTQKGVSYNKLKGALIPNQDKDKFETCLVIDSSKINHEDYRYYIFDTLLPLLDTDSTYSVLYGDYADVLQDVKDSQSRLHSALSEVLHRCNPSHYQYSTQYFLIYFNRLTGSQRWRIVEDLLPFPWFTGFADMTRGSLFKTYLSYTLSQVLVKCGQQILAPHPCDCPDEENQDESDLPFEKHGFQFISINEDSFGSFLSYKIESIAPDVEDVSFSFNALFPKFDSISRLRLAVEDKKWYNYLTDPDDKKKGNLLQAIGYGPDDRNAFICDIYRKICASYIYNLRKNDYGDLLFNVCVDLPTIHGNYRKTTIALKYHPNDGVISIVTIT